MRHQIEGVTFRFRRENDWAGNDHVKVKGYAFDPLGNFYDGSDLALLFVNIRSVEELVSLAQSFNGLYCAAGVLGFGTFALTDRIRSHPLFYTNNTGKFSLSDNPYDLVDSPVFGTLPTAEFKTAGYTMGKNTLYEDVFQVEAASLVLFKNNVVTITEYFNYTAVNTKKRDYNECKKELKEILDRAMQRMVESVNGRPIAIPLSGGYDSRFILAWLVNNGYGDIIAFTYGKNNNPDMLLAERVAKKLNVRWICVPYDNIVNELGQDKYLEDYVLYGSNASSMPFFQDYPAIKMVHEKNLISSNSVIIPGHSGDFIAGSHLLPRMNLKTLAQLATDIFDAHNVYYDISRVDRSRIVNGYHDFFNNYSSSIPYSVSEWWNFKERQAKFIVNSCRAYQFFGYGIRLPFYDAELIDFFRTMPFEYKLFKKIYKDALEDYYFRPLGLVFHDELQPTPFDYKRKMFKQYISGIIPFLKRFSRQNDFHCYEEIASILFEKYHFSPDPRYRRKLLNSLIVDWYLNYLKKNSKVLPEKN